MILRLFLYIFFVCVTSFAAHLDSPEYQIQASYIDSDGKRYTSSFNVHEILLVSRNSSPPWSGPMPASTMLKTQFASRTQPPMQCCSEFITGFLKRTLPASLLWFKESVTAPNHAEQEPLSTGMLRAIPDTTEWSIMPRYVFQDGVDGPAFLLLGPEGGTLVGRDKPST